MLHAAPQCRLNELISIREIKLVQDSFKIKKENPLEPGSCTDHVTYGGGVLLQLSYYGMLCVESNYFYHITM